MKLALVPVEPSEEMSCAVENFTRLKKDSFVIAHAIGIAFRNTDMEAALFDVVKAANLFECGYAQARDLKAAIDRARAHPALRELMDGVAP